MDLVQTLLRQFGPNVAGVIAARLGVSPAVVQTALGALVPALLAALIGKVQAPGGADEVMRLAERQDPGAVDDLAGTLGGGQQDQAQVADRGLSMLGGLFDGGKVEALASGVGGFAGLPPDGARSLLGMAAPAVMGLIGRQATAGGLDAGGLATMLLGQKDNVAAAMPAGLAERLGGTGLLSGVADRLGGIGAGTGAVATGAGAAVAGAGAAGIRAAASAGQAETARRPAPVVQDVAGSAHRDAATPAGSGSSLPRWLVPLALAVAAIALLWQFLPRPAEDPEPVTQAPAPTPPAATTPEPTPPAPPPDVAATPAPATPPTEATPAPDIAAPAPDVATPAPTPDVVPPAPDVAPSAPDVAAPPPDVVTPTPDVAAPTPDVTAPTPDVATPTPTPDIATPAVPDLTVGGVDLGTQFAGIVDGVTTRLRGVTDVASAQAVVPELTDLGTQLETVGSSAGQLPAEAGRTFAGQVAAALPQFRSVVDAALALPGVGDVLRPVAEPMLRRLEALAG